MFLLAWDWIYYCVIASISPTITRSSSIDYSHIRWVNVWWKSMPFLGCCWYWRSCVLMCLSVYWSRRKNWFGKVHVSMKPASWQIIFNISCNLLVPGGGGSLHQDKSHGISQTVRLWKVDFYLTFAVRVQQGKASSGSQTLSSLKH